MLARTVSSLGLIALVSCAAVDPIPQIAPTYAVADARLPLTSVESAAPTPSALAQATGDSGVRSFDFTLGQRRLDEDDWEPLDEQAAVGFQYAQQSNGAPVGFEVGLLLSFDDDTISGVDVEAAVGELYAGVHRSFGSSASSVRPYVGAGLALISAEIEGSSGGTSVDDDDSSPGIYAHGGVAFQAGSNFRFGIDLRLLTGTDIDLFGVSGDADYVQLGLFLGFGR